MHATFNDHFKCRDKFPAGSFRLIKVMLVTLTFIWIVNIFVLIVSPPVSSKSKPCFTDGDCPSALEKCEYGSWKGLGNCHRKTRETTPGQFKRIQRSDAKRIFRNRRLVRRKRNPSNIWNDSYLSQKRWDVWLSPSRRDKEAPGRFLTSAIRDHGTNEQFDGVVTDLLTVGRSYITFNGINYTIAVIPSENSDSDWFVTLTRDISDMDKNRLRNIAQKRHKLGEAQHPHHHRYASPDAKSPSSLLLENSFENYHNADEVVNISVRYPINMYSRRGYRGHSGFRLRFRRQLPMRLTELNSIDPLINRLTPVDPVIPAVEDILGKNVGKRSTNPNKVTQRARRELEEIEDEVAPLPKVLTNPEEGPIIIEELFAPNRRSSTLRKKRHHDVHIPSQSRRDVGTRYKRHHKMKKKARSTAGAGSSSLSRRSRRNKRRNHVHSVSHRSTKEVQSNTRVKNSLSSLNQHHKENVRGRDAVKREYGSTGKAARDIPALRHSKNDRKRSKETELGGNDTATKPGATTEPPDPFASLEGRKDPHIDYYDVSKRGLLGDDEDLDPESSLSAAPPHGEEALDVDNLQREESRRKRQTIAEELEDDDGQDIPSWRQTVELLRRANTFAVPAHDSSGHVVLVRRVRDLGALDLGESLVKLKETMAKIFGRCSPARRRKRSQRAPAEVVTDQLSNQETWEIEGEGNEVVDQAKIDVHMDDDKPYNVTTVFRPMGKRSNSFSGRENQAASALKHLKMGIGSERSREMRDIIDQSAHLDKIQDLKSFENGLGVSGSEHHERYVANSKNMFSIRQGSELKRESYSNEGRQVKSMGRAANSKRDEQNVPLNKDVHFNAPEGSPAGIQLTVDEPSASSQSTASAKVSSGSASTSQGSVTRRNGQQSSPFANPVLFSEAGQASSRLVSSRNPSRFLRDPLRYTKNQALKDIASSDGGRTARRGSYEGCVGCNRLSQSVLKKASGDQPGRKIVREPYIITRRYNDSKTRSVRAEGSARKTRELGETGGLDRANLLYLADGDPLPARWRVPLVSVKRDVDVSAKVTVEGAGNGTDQNKIQVETTSVAPSTVEGTVEHEDDDDVFSGKSSTEGSKKSSSVQATASLTSEVNSASPGRSASLVLGSQMSSNDPHSVRTKIMNLPPPRQKSVVRVESNDRNPVVDETITTGGLDWGISGSSDRLMGLISDIEKALRVPLGGSDSSPGLDQLTFIDSNNGAMKAQIISNQPEITEQQSSYMYSFNEPRPLVVATSSQEKRPEVVKMDITAGTGGVATNVGELSESIYLKGFDVPRKPSKHVFVDSAAKKMIWVEPSYKTVISAGSPKYKTPFNYVRIYDDGPPRPNPINQWTQIRNIQDVNTVEDVQLGDSKEVTVEQFAEQPSGTAITNIRASKTSEILQPPGVFDIHGNIAVNGQLFDNAAPEEDQNTVVKVISSLSSDAPGSADAAIPGRAPSVSVHVDGDDDGARIIRSKNMPSNIRSIIQNKKDLEEVEIKSGNTPGISMKQSTLLSSDGVVLSEGKLDDSTEDDVSSIRAPGDKRDARHIYRVPKSHNTESSKRMVNSKDTIEATKRADTNPAQPAQVVHTYSKDPGVQGATMEMMTNLASRLSSQNAQKRNSPILSSRNVACVGINGNCRQKKLVQLSGAAGSLVSPGSNQGYILPFKTQQFFGPANNRPIKQLKKRDVSRTIFEEPKVYVTSQKTIYEAPGTKYKFVDAQERNGISKHTKVYTVSDKSDPIESNILIDKTSNSGTSSKARDNQFRQDSPSSLPLSHEKALQEAAGQERYKIIDSDEGFSGDVPTFDKKITSGGQIAEDQIAPIPMESNRDALRHEDDRVLITTDVRRKKLNHGLKISGSDLTNIIVSPISPEQSRTVESVGISTTSSDSHGQVRSNDHLADKYLTSYLRKKRRSSETETNHRINREENVKALRSELQNLNDIGSKLGLNFFDKSSIDRIVREVSQHGSFEGPQNKALRHRSVKSSTRTKNDPEGSVVVYDDGGAVARETHKKKRTGKNTDIDVIVKKNVRGPSNIGTARKIRGRKTKHASDIQNVDLSESSKTMFSKSVSPQNNGRADSHAKRKLNKKRVSMSRQDRRRKIFKRHNTDFQPMRDFKASNKFPRGVENQAEVASDIITGPVYNYHNAVNNDDLLTISNPENHYLSNDRQREETVKVSNEASEPMEMSAVLRGRRKKRGIQPDEYLRFSREEPLRRSLLGNRPLATSNPSLSGAWHKQLAPARLNREEDILESNEGIPSMRETFLGESKPAHSGFQDVFNSPRAVFSRRPEQQFFNTDSRQKISGVEMTKRQQLVDVFPSQRNVGSLRRQMASESQQSPPIFEERGTGVHDTKSSLNDKVIQKVINQGSIKPTRNDRDDIKRKPVKGLNTTTNDISTTPQKSKGPDVSVWKKLGEIFDISHKETADLELETTSLPTSSPNPLQAMVPDEEAIHSAPLLGKSDERDGAKKPPEQSSKSDSGDDRGKSGLRAAIVDRLLQDLRKMASARGSEMARAESDLIEILHDYQTDLMDEDEKTIAGEPFQGVRIHDNVAIPVIYPAVPIKMEGLSQHRIVVRSIHHHALRDRSKSWHKSPFNPP